MLRAPLPQPKLPLFRNHRYLLQGPDHERMNWNPTANKNKELSNDDTIQTVNGSKNTKECVHNFKPQLSRPRLSGIFDYPDLPLRPLFHKYQSVTFDICNFFPSNKTDLKKQCWCYYISSASKNDRISHVVSSLTDLPQHLGPKPLSKYFKWQILEMMLNDLRKSLYYWVHWYSYFW